MPLTASEGTVLREIGNVCRWILLRHPVPFKVGMARLLGTRWEHYVAPASVWKPTHMFFLWETEGRAAVGFLEAAMIAELNRIDIDASLNINFQRGDRGGTGPRLEEFQFAKYKLYLAVKAY